MFLFCLFTPSVLPSPSSVPPTQRPWLHIQPGWDRRPLRPFRRPHPQPLTPGITIDWSSSLILLIRWRWEQVQESVERTWTPLRSTYRLMKKGRQEQIIENSYFQGTMVEKQMLKYYIFGLLCIINSCLCISFPACECVDIHRVCAWHLQEGEKNTLRKPFPIR